MYTFENFFHNALLYLPETENGNDEGNYFFQITDLFLWLLCLTFMEPLYLLQVGKEVEGVVVSAVVSVVVSVMVGYWNKWIWIVIYVRMAKRDDMIYAIYVGS